MECKSGFTIFLLMLLISMFNGMTVRSMLLDFLILTSAVVFYIYQRDMTGCKYPDYNV